MTTDQAVRLVGLLAAGAFVVCLALVLALATAVARLRARSARLAEELADVRQRLDQLGPATSRPPGAGAATTPHPVEFVITDLGREPEPDDRPVRLDGPAFADIVLKETVVKAASLAHGVRRGLAPATRNRIRFAMRQEVKRSRKQRRADLKAAHRHLRREAS